MAQCKFICGYAAALADVKRLHGDDGTVADCLKEAGLTLADLKKAKVDEYDLTELEKVLG